MKFTVLALAAAVLATSGYFLFRSTGPGSVEPLPAPVAAPSTASTPTQDAVLTKLGSSEAPRVTPSNSRSSAAEGAPADAALDPLPGQPAGGVAITLAEVPDPDAERIAAKYKDQDGDRRRRAALEISGILFGETQIPADTKEGRLDPAIVNELKAEYAWLQGHLDP